MHCVSEFLRGLDLVAEHQRFLSERRRPGARSLGGRREPPGLWHRPVLLNLVADLLVLFVILSLLYALAMWLLARPYFQVSDVRVLTPSANVTVAQLEYVARSSVTGNFFTVNLEKVRIDLEKLPWVDRAEVRRQWPDTLEIRLREHQAVAYWASADSDEMHLVNQRGEIFVASSNLNMPVFSGPVGSAPFLLQRHREYVDKLAAIGREPKSLSLSARHAWELRLDNGMLLLLGRDAGGVSVSERLARFVKTWPQASEKLNNEPMLVADLRYRTGYALRPLAAQE